ncbi:tetratricopeptide repeat protein [Streptomyces sp. NPDC051243]|uniref:tetratricopeptide repeat protein n=1 Tax=Streptomyces sp. NPDC051243 TaxID=3365646 RepID=UPI0037AEA320
MESASFNPEPPRQVISAVNGFAYGAQGADIHVFGDGTPLYLLQNWKPPAALDRTWLRELPSRMLNARFQVVGFTGRNEELDQLRQWRDDGPQLSARLLHAPGGQGKTRLADRLAEDSTAGNWKTVTALQGPGTVFPPPGSQDLRLDGTAGLLLIVDYADQWPLTHLIWLLSNALLHQTGVRTRILLLARTTNDWPRVRAALANLQAATSSQKLHPLPSRKDARDEMFTAARNAFASHYGLGEATGIAPPESLSRPEMSLTLAVHMAALVAVDAHAAGRRPPDDIEGLTIYLLDREHLHWARLYGDESRRLKPSERRCRTPPHQMNQAVFTATLTGTVPSSTAAAVLGRLPMASDPEQIVADHSICYPSADPGHAFEPLYPDRLAEDFLALTLIGHTADYPSQPWASDTLRTVLTSEGDTRGAPAWASRSVVFLAASAGPGRWTHVTKHLNEVLTTDPALAIAAGSAALTALAEVSEPDFDVFEAVVEQFPDGRHPDLDPGIAALAARVTSHRLAHTEDPAERAGLYSWLAIRQTNAGLYDQALDSARSAEKIWRPLAKENQAEYEHEWAESLASLGNRLGDVGRHGEALATAEETLGLYRRFSRGNVAYEPHLARSLGNLGVHLSAVGRREEALEAAGQAVQLYRRLGGHEAELATMLANLGVDLWAMERREEALNATEEAVKLYRRLAQLNPIAHEPDLARCLNNLGVRLSGMSRPDEAQKSTEEAVRLYDRLAQANPALYEPRLAGSLGNLAAILPESQDNETILTLKEHATEIFRRLAEAKPALHEPHLADSLAGLGVTLSALGQADEALAVVQEAVVIRRRLARRNESVHAAELARSLSNLGLRLAAVGRYADARIAAKESVDICRGLSQANPVIYEPHLAGALTAFAAARENVDAEMEQIDAEVVQLYRKLAAATPKAFCSNLQMALSAHATVLDALGRAKEADKIRLELGVGHIQAPALAGRILRWIKSWKSPRGKEQ